MKIVDNILVSDDLKDTFFACNLHACHGDCCVEGDAGAPLEEEEISILEDYLDDIKPFMDEKGLKVVEQLGVFDYDIEGDYATPLVNERACAFLYQDGDIQYCAIEKAWLEGRIPFQKPVSCHLYPIRLDKVGDSIAINYHKWHICAPALIEGKKRGEPLYVYLKDPLIRKFGKDWYSKLVLAMCEK
jgi:Fe-S-cluster containining protein